MAALGWQPGDRLDLDIIHQPIVAVPNVTGRHTVDNRGGIALPAATRRMCGIEPGPPVILAALPNIHTLVIYPATVAGRLLAAHYTFIGFAP